MCEALYAYSLLDLILFIVLDLLMMMSAKSVSSFETDADFLILEQLT